MPGALVAAGFTGHGFGFAWVCGRALAELVTDGHSRVAELLTSRRMR
jgi:glycine/D-amino acid oxidase-like deaminating enzyme